ncbi:MAG: 3'(2'),5'-bisphosphate nucleotidase CysQ [Spirochaetales bacterium]|nr:3'(2'),5'-bisphosphate nucleotidase CysQ [Spirochaetales bacterium]
MSNVSETIDALVDTMITAALQAGNEVMHVYQGDIAVEMKDDRSPLTEADRRSHTRIDTILEEAMTRGTIARLPLLSEEGTAIPYATRRRWDSFFMIDPLDGTKEFIKRNDEFTVNIALMARSGDTEWYPRLGVVYAPALGELFVGREDSAFYWSDIAPSSPPPSVAAGETLPRAGYDDERPFTIVASRSHMSAETEEFVETRRREHPDLELVSAGSSLKLCRVADGSADEYPRFAPTMEWDTAAGDAVARSAGCDVRSWDSRRGGAQEPLFYNKEDLHNPWFLVRRA